ncbi:MFS general substrate transporter [Crucibulum laeve]|uniref:MFS general substrate transporter n=1 Tax=Crucibulum laeve TaxID=68775 RepID=A0A5C3M4G4_9AGAR|nr:MFS general substrate transporter [Crucibulum laeve]
MTSEFKLQGDQVSNEILEEKDEIVRPAELDIFAIHELIAGRLVLDPQEAREEFGDEIASRLKLTKDGTKVLWPQPSDDPQDPQNWSDYKKNVQLAIITLAAIVPDFNSGIGIASVFPLAKQFDTTTGRINNLTSNWSIFLIGWGGLFFVMLIRRYGRLPILFWTQLLGLAFQVGATFAPNLKVFAAMRCLNGFFTTCPQVTGLYTITDLFPFHLQARKINIWTMGVILAPHLSPFLFGFLVARTTWRWAYGIGSLYGLLVLFLIIFFMEESMYNRYEQPVPPIQRTFTTRLMILLGITGIRNVKPNPTWSEVVISPLKVLWRPHMLSILLFEAMVFGFGIGINVTNTIFLQSPPPVGFGLDPTIVSGIYATPVIAVFIGEILGRYLNDWVMNTEIKRNNGVFKAEARLWTCYVGVTLYVTGFVILGSALQNHFNQSVVIIGWAIAQVAVLVNTVAVYAYCNDCFPRRQGEISALLNLVRTLGGFSVTYFQVPWATRHGALQTLGVEAAIVAGLFLFIIPILQWKGRFLRVSILSSRLKNTLELNILMYLLSARNAFP